MSFWSDLMARKNLIKSFRAGSIYKTIGSDEKKIFPKIHSIRSNDFSIEYVFTLPTGLNPDLLKKNYFAFEQVFGTEIKLDGEAKKFVLTIHKTKLPKELTYKYSKFESELKGVGMPIVCGMDSEGKWMIYDAITEPNCLISGEPGAGKSTQLRSILTTLIQTKKPSELEIYLGDLKMSEFFLFKEVQHVKSVCVYPEDMARMLSYLHNEMTRRGELLNKYKVTHVTKLPDDVKVPFILLCIDEFVMIMDDKEMKKQIVQLVALGRALGMYCILSLQRPSHDILDTKIRGLLTVRMGFRTTDLQNAKIIGTPGSETISRETPGRFFLKRDTLDEIQAPYLTDKTAEKILERYKSSKDCKANIGDSERLEKVLTEKEVFNDVK